MSNKRGLGRLCDRLTPEERFRVDVSALARGDEEESERLAVTRPLRDYTMRDRGFVGRWEALRGNRPGPRTHGRGEVPGQGKDDGSLWRRVSLPARRLARRRAPGLTCRPRGGEPPRVERVRQNGRAARLGN